MLPKHEARKVMPNTLSEMCFLRCLVLYVCTKREATPSFSPHLFLPNKQKSDITIPTDRERQEEKEKKKEKKERKKKKDKEKEKRKNERTREKRERDRKKRERREKEREKEMQETFRSLQVRAEAGSKTRSPHRKWSSGALPQCRQRKRSGDPRSTPAS